MKNIYSIFFFSLLVLSACQKDLPPKDGDDDVIIDPSLLNTTDYIFDIDAIPEITLSFSLAEWNKFLDNYDRNSHNEEHVMASFSFTKSKEAAVIDSIGVRLKGNTSRRRPEGNRGEKHDLMNPDWHHAHFGLHFDQFIENQTFSGTDRLNLKWFKDDGNYAKEVYCYDLFHRFYVWTSPRATYCRLTIHVEGDDGPAYFGVYEMVESVQEQFIDDRVGEGFIGDDGFLWKCTWGTDLRYSPNVMEKMGVEEVLLDGHLSRTYPYDLKNNQENLTQAKLQLQEFMFNLVAKQGDEFISWIAEAMDVDLFLKTYAVNVIVGMWDDYWVNQNNYYIYFDEDGKFYFIPYDYDNTLGTSLIVDNSGTQDLLRWGSMTERPLINKILGIPKYKSAYQEYIGELIDPSNDLFDAEKSMSRIRAWQKKIKAYLVNDTGEDMYLEDYPAYWGNCDFYCLLSGNDEGGKEGPANYFKTRIRYALDGL